MAGGRIRGVGSTLIAGRPIRPRAMPQRRRKRRRQFRRSHDESADRQVCVRVSQRAVEDGRPPARQFDLTGLASSRPGARRVVRKLRAGMMRRPACRAPTRRRWSGSFAHGGGAGSAGCHPSAAAGLHRMNRTEYANAIRDLLALEVDSTKFLPPDTDPRFETSPGR